MKSDIYEMSDEERLPKNLQGLLRFAMQYTRNEDAPHESHWQQMDPERKKFLEDALKSMTVDVIEEFEKALEVLNRSDASPEERVDALQIVEDYAENIDFADNFVKIGGTGVVVDCLKSDLSEVRAAAASLIAVMCQNNIYCQKHFLEINIIPKLVELLSDEQSVAVKAMHALSCMVRSYEPCLAALIEIGGLECILGCLGSGEEKIMVKSAFLIGALSKDHNAVREQFIKLGAIERLSEYLEVPDEYCYLVETFLDALMILTEQEDVASEHLTGRLKDKLENIVNKTKGKPEFEETIEYSKTLLARCSSDTLDDTDR